MTDWKRVREIREEKHEELLAELDRQDKVKAERDEEAKQRPWDGK